MSLTYESGDERNGIHLISTCHKVGQIVIYKKFISVIMYFETL